MISFLMLQKNFTIKHNKENVLDAEHESLLKMEQQCCSYIACDAEDRESARPEYDYEAVQIKLADNDYHITI